MENANEEHHLWRQNNIDVEQKMIEKARACNEYIIEEGWRRKRLYVHQKRRRKKLKHSFLVSVIFIYFLHVYDPLHCMSVSEPVWIHWKEERRKKKKKKRDLKRKESGIATALSVQQQQEPVRVPQELEEAMARPVSLFSLSNVLNSVNWERKSNLKCL